MRELGLAPWVMVPEPNTWRELLAAIDKVRSTEGSIDGLDVAVQEYGVSNPDLVKGLEARGARVTSVPVYRWALPEDLEPLRAAVVVGRARRGGRRDLHHRHAGGAPLPGRRHDAAGRRRARRACAAWSSHPSARRPARSCGSSSSRSISKPHIRRWASSCAKPPNAPPICFEPNVRSVRLQPDSRPGRFSRTSSLERPGPRPVFPIPFAIRHGRFPAATRRR